jgi:hypothetical protein
LAEGPLHAALKQLYVEPGAEVEAPRCGYVVDVALADGRVVEVQTGGFSRLKVKLEALLAEHDVVLVHPIAAERRVVRVDDRGEVVSDRRSPRRGTPFSIFDQLVFLPARLLEHERLTVEVALTLERVVHTPPDGRRRRRRPAGRRHLVEVLDRAALRTPADLLALVPGELEEPFTVRELAAATKSTPLVAGRCAYVLRSLGLLAQAGKRGPAPLYTRA